MIIIKEIELSDEKEFVRFENRYKAECGNEPVPFSLNPRNLSYAEFFAELVKLKDKATCPEGYVPATYYLMFDDGRIVGAINLRRGDNEFILNRAGHIGYGVAPWERNKGYATQGLKLCLNEARKAGMNRVLLTTDLDNAASQRVIAKCGGVFGRDNRDKKLFWIDLN